MLGVVAWQVILFLVPLSQKAFDIPCPIFPAYPLLFLKAQSHFLQKAPTPSYPPGSDPLQRTRGTHIAVSLHPESAIRRCGLRPGRQRLRLTLDFPTVPPAVPACRKCSICIAFCPSLPTEDLPNQGPIWPRTLTLPWNQGHHPQWCSECGRTGGSMLPQGHAFHSASGQSVHSLTGPRAP